MVKIRFFVYPVLVCLTIFMVGCAGMGEVTAPSRPVQKKESGLYHKVRAKETLWRISKMYGVNLETLAAANSLPDKKKIYEGQVLFIPQADAKGFGDVPKERSFIWPIKGKIISYYGSTTEQVNNKGIDIKARHGEPVAASRSGKVSFIDDKMKGFGMTIILDHDDGYSTVYAYNSQILVETGQNVRQGTVIAKAGQSGRAASPRLHFEIRKKHEPQNPLHFLP
ncbi:MAG: LysM peptidoglycan-binding domain-containing M23 family metallopeptidase [Candidatus Omnitrophota bacterium]